MKISRTPAIAATGLALSACATLGGPSGTRHDAKLEGQSAVDPANRNVLVNWVSNADATQDSIYWQPPTQITAFLNGQLLVRVQRLANMRRRPSLLDQGYLVDFSAVVSFYNVRNANGQCSGALVHSAEYPIITLGYKQEQPGATSTTYDRRIQELGGTIRCIGNVIARKRLR